MTNQTPLWQPLSQDMPVTMATNPRTLTLAAASEGALRLHSEAPLPEGELILMATCETRVTHWVQTAQRQGNDLLIPTAGLEQVYLSQPEEHWTLELGQLDRSHIQGWKLTAGSLKPYYKKAEGYFLDDRSHYGAPVCTFAAKGTRWEAVPNWANPDGLLSLRFAPCSQRYLPQLTCRMDTFAAAENALHMTLAVPKGAEMPVAVTLTAEDGTLTAPLFPVKDGTAIIPFSQLDTAAPCSLLCAVAEVLPDGTPLLLAPRILSRDTAAAITAYSAKSAATIGKQQLFLSMTENLRLSLQWSEELPGGEGSTLSLADYLAAKPRLRSRCFSTALGGKDLHWELQLDGLDLSDADECSLVLHRWRSHKDYPCPTVLLSADEGGTRLSADLTPIMATLESCLRDDFHAAVAFHRGGKIWYLPLFDTAHLFYGKQHRSSTFNDQTDFFSEPVGSVDHMGHSVEATPYWETDGRCSIMLADQLLRYYPTLTCRATGAKLRFGKLRMSVQCPKVEGRWVGLAVAHRYKLEVDRCDYLLPISAVKRGKGCDIITINAPLTHMKFAPVYWDLRMVFERDGQQFYLSIKAPPLKKQTPVSALKTGLSTLFFSESVKVDKDNQLFLYRTAGNRYALVFQERSKYSGFAFRMKERLAFLIYLLFRKQLHARHIMLTYEKYCCMAQDNGFYFFQYCMENHIEEQLHHQIYYIITPDSVDYDNVKPYEDHVIPFMSLKHMVYLLACQLMVSSDSKPHAYAWRCKESLIQPRIERMKPLVFLQHGVIALKKVEFFDAATNAVNLFVTSNRREHGIIVRELGYRPEDVIITGLTRWDVLHDRSAEVKGNHILVMPTWRNWLEDTSDEAFRQSNYYRNYMELLNSQRLADWLEQRDAYLDFYIHPKFRDYLGNFSIFGERVRLIPFGSEPLNRLIMQCKMLITDYSSVCWDVYYQGKPCIFYQFDVEQYNEAQGAYIDLETEMFGDRAMDNDHLFALMEEAAASDYALKPRYAQMRLTSYEYLDHNNSQRVCDEIRRRNW